MSVFDVVALLWVAGLMGWIMYAEARRRARERELEHYAVLSDTYFNMRADGLDAAVLDLSKRVGAVERDLEPEVTGEVVEGD